MSNRLNQTIATGILGIKVLNPLSGIISDSPIQEAVDNSQEQSLVAEVPKETKWYPAITHGSTQTDQLGNQIGENDSDRARKKRELDAATKEANTPKAGSGSNPPNDTLASHSEGKSAQPSTELPAGHSENGVPGRTIPQDEYDRRQNVIDKYAIRPNRNAELAQSLRGDTSSPSSTKDDKESSDISRNGDHKI